MSLFSLYFLPVLGFNIEILSIRQDLDLFDIISFDAELGKTLQELQVLVERKRFLESSSGKNQLEVDDLCFRGARIEDLCLDFTLPGFPDYVLKEGEQNTTVSNMFISVIMCLHLLSSFWDLYRVILYSLG